MGITEAVPGRAGYTLWERGLDMIKDQPFSATFKLDKETKNTVRYTEEAEDPVLLIKHNEAYNSVDRIVDQFEDCAKAPEAVAMKHF